jgi:hypothetical protein
MRRWIVFVFLMTVPLSAGAARRVTVAQLEKTLDSAIAGHKSDAELARRIGTMELSERLTEATLDRLVAPLKTLPQAALSLQLLADESTFLDPPPSELPGTLAPDDTTQQRMLAAAHNYVAQTLPHLPNFLATRIINRYDDSAHALKKGDWPVRSGLHRVDTSSQEISVIDERENQPATQGTAVWERQIGLISGGEFGTTLGMVLTDSLNGRITWSRWEQIDGSPAAVFQYAVPRPASHFELISTLQRESAIEGVATPSGTRGVAGIGARLNTDPSRVSILHIKPAYHGLIWVDPDSGTILRITIEAELKDSDPFRDAAILVQYGPIKIGDGTFICPVRSLALSMAAFNAQSGSADGPTTWLNETLFTNYHRFASTTRIIANPASPQ